MLAESVSGYLLNWRLYSPSEKDETENKHKLLKVVMYLTNNYLEKGHHIYMDRYYTSPIIANFLYLNGTNICGTVL